MAWIGKRAAKRGGGGGGGGGGVEFLSFIINNSGPEYQEKYSWGEGVFPL